MAKCKVTSKGQVTIPKEVRDSLGLRPGDEIEFVEEHGVFRVRRYLRESPFDKWVGYLKDKPMPGYEGMSVDDMIDEWRGR